MERKILYLKVPSFPIALEVLRDPSLKGKPVAICASGSYRSLLQAVSPEARLDGLSRGMSRQEAVRRSPSLRVLAPDPRLYEWGAQTLFKSLSAYSPLVEQARPGSLFMDLTGTRRLFGPARDIAWKIRREVRTRIGLDALLGMAANKLLSRIAVKVLPESGLCDVFPGGEKHFLEPLEIEVLPAARHPHHAERLRDLAIRHVAHLLPISLPLLQIAFGRTSLSLYRQARGIDESPVRPPYLSPRITEEETLPEESNEDAFIRAVVQGLTEEAGRRLRDMKIGARRMELEIQYADTVVARRSVRLDTPTDLDSALFGTACRLLETTAVRRVRLRRITIHCMELERLHVQPELFPRWEKREEESSLFASHGNRVLPDREQCLQKAIDEIRSRFGKDGIRTGSQPEKYPRRRAER